MLRALQGDVGIFYSSVASVAFPASNQLLGSQILDIKNSILTRNIVIFFCDVHNACDAYGASIVL